MWPISAATFRWESYFYHDKRKSIQYCKTYPEPQAAADAPPLSARTKKRQFSRLWLAEAKLLVRGEEMAPAGEEKHQHSPLGLSWSRIFPEISRRGIGSGAWHKCPPPCPCCVLSTGNRKPSPTLFIVLTLKTSLTLCLRNWKFDARTMNAFESYAEQTAMHDCRAGRFEHNKNRWNSQGVNILATAILPVCNHHQTLKRQQRERDNGSVWVRLIGEEAIICEAWMSLKQEYW